MSAIKDLFSSGDGAEEIDVEEELTKFRDALEDLDEALEEVDLEAAAEALNELDAIATCPLCEAVARQMHAGVEYIIASPPGRRPIIAQQVGDEAWNYISEINEDLDELEE